MKSLLSSLSVALCTLIFVSCGAQEITPDNTNTIVVPGEQSLVTAAPLPEGLEITSPLPGEMLTSPFIIRGSSSSWLQDDIMPVSLRDDRGQILSQGFVTKETQDSFSGEIQFPASSSTSGSITFTNENTKEEYELPVLLSPSSQQLLYYPNSLKSAESSTCGMVFPISRVSPSLDSPDSIFTALKSTLGENEKAGGYFTSVLPSITLSKSALNGANLSLTLTYIEDFAIAPCIKENAEAQIKNSMIQLPGVDTVTIEWE